MRFHEGADKILSEKLPHLSWWQKMKLKIGIPPSVGMYRHDGWSGCLEHYMIHCDKHGYLVTYKMGFSKRLSCWKCFEEQLF